MILDLVWLLPFVFLKKKINVLPQTATVRCCPSASVFIDRVTACSIYRDFEAMPQRATEFILLQVDG